MEYSALPQKKRTTWLSSLVLCLMFGPAIAFSSSGTRSAARVSFVPSNNQMTAIGANYPKNIHMMITQLRGGQVEEVTMTATDDDATVVQEDVEVTTEEESTAVVEEESAPVELESETAPVATAAAVSSSVFSSVTGALQSFGSAYATSLNARPIITKSVTACFIFSLSDYFAQRLEGRPSKEEEEAGLPKKKVKKKDPSPPPVTVYNWTRTLTSAAVGLLYFGPAAHTWYEKIFQLLPGTSLGSTLSKAALGQLLFGPSFTCVFFATSLLQAGTFSIPNWFRKIKQDLPGAWAAGLGFWPLVDLISYSFIPPQWIPLFVNFCSFLWTIYLSTIANRSSK